MTLLRSKNLRELSEILHREALEPQLVLLQVHGGLGAGVQRLLHLHDVTVVVLQQVLTLLSRFNRTTSS